MDIAQASGIKAMRLTHSGEDGWILYIPSEVSLFGKNKCIKLLCDTVILKDSH